MTRSIYSKEYKNVIEKLKEARLVVALKQVDVAKKLKKPQSYISKVERGERRLDVIELEAFAKLYKKSIDFFLNQ